MFPKGKSFRSLKNSNLSFFFLHVSSFSCCMQKLFAKSQRDFLLCALLHVIEFCTSHLGVWTSWVNFCVSYEINISDFFSLSLSLFFLLMVFHLFHHPLLISFLYLIAFVFLWKINLLYLRGCISGFFSVPLIYVSILLPITHCNIV